MNIRVPESVVMALELDDGSVRESYRKSPGVSIALDGKGAEISGLPECLVKFADDIQCRASSEYDLPFNIRGACGRVAKRIIRDVSPYIRKGN